MLLNQGHQNTALQALQMFLFQALFEFLWLIRLPVHRLCLRQLLQECGLIFFPHWIRNDRDYFHSNLLCHRHWIELVEQRLQYWFLGIRHLTLRCFEIDRDYTFNGSDCQDSQIIKFLDNISVHLLMVKWSFISDIIDIEQSEEF